MQEDLKQLANRIDQAVELCQHLWQENVALKDQVLITQADNRKLNEKLSTVLEKLETMLDALPPDEEGQRAIHDEDSA
jgi:ABC-type nitrate/sulfonate/bicarbonate transport system ATPase subunit